eukprot:Gb_07133 [translate_table: standard]
MFRSDGRVDVKSLSANPFPKPKHCCRVYWCVDVGRFVYAERAVASILELPLPSWPTVMEGVAVCYCTRFAAAAGAATAANDQQAVAEMAGSGSGNGGAGSGSGGEFGDTTYTKVFVGGLAWETQRDTMRLYFEQFGEILEAVVITDKNTGRSKGYGFVTFRDPDAARRACVDASPIIDGRRANCNLASLGARRSRPSTPQPGAVFYSQSGNRFRIMTSFPTSLQTGGHGYPSGVSFPQSGQYALQQGFPYHVYGFSPYSADYPYQPNYYSPYGGAQFPQMYPGQGMISSTAVYPYYQFNQPLQGSAGYPQAQTVGVPHIFQYPSQGTGSTVSSLPQHYGAVISTPAAVIPSTGMTLSLPPDAVAATSLPAAQQYPIHPATQ